MTKVSRNARRILMASGCLVLASTTALAGDFDPRQGDVKTLVDEVSAQGVDRAWLERAMNEASFSQGVLDAMSGAVERHLTWHEYRDIFLGEERVAKGVRFIDQHREAFERAQREYQVPPEIIAAILGVETRYGEVTGDHRVLDSLSTLAFHHGTRGGFFRGELAAFLEIAYEQDVDPGDLEGSYAGAMGYPQFIPTSYRAYAVDFDGDGTRNLWTDPVDAIGSVGNYFSEHRWQGDAPIYLDAEGPTEPPSGIEFNQAQKPYVSVSELQDAGITPERALTPDTRVIPLALELADGDYRYRLGLDNFYVITRYNHSYLYAMAVTELAEAIAKARGESKSWFESTAIESEEHP
ncbi:lytic murein transglycosylase B [Halomonas elongata]|uniref:Lytic murein transglycosylase MltB n=2 Tax=Halomonas elongata (strain ATCC 33173 / DSM 2581 / NBRC 15536 / NCIMB 2198 / 1H9) TaxID=768066 RepID=E1VB22_HALED|nr:lytic murein transglycosylase B [Halomonas elongata]WBF19355.1 lytic murein transglycosylase B [Halomonas elongata]CBV42083.1 lytic murein transglycosylase MltB [Halomonas elongata DSM 2581]